jgi:hypothetical protein
MVEVRPSAWGHAGRYYAGSGLDAPRLQPRGSLNASSGWAGALEQASPGIRNTIDRTHKQWNTILRDFLRSETGLRLAVGGDSQSVPVRVVDGMPRRFAEVITQFDGFEWLLLNRPAVAAAVSGTQFMERHAEKFLALWAEEGGPSDEQEIRRVQETAANWLNKLNAMKALEQITGIDEDVLGAYFFRIPEVRLYWIVIGIIARALGVSAESLTIVVLAHELAHAYTHLGRDIDNERWETERFAGADLDIVEGLAQFYTQTLCARLDQRMPAALEAYQALLKLQRGPYRAHLEWFAGNEHAGEIVRVAMIECRSRGITASSDFSAAVSRYRVGVRGGKQVTRG